MIQLASIHIDSSEGLDILIGGVNVRRSIVVSRVSRVVGNDSKDEGWSVRKTGVVSEGMKSAIFPLDARLILREAPYCSRRIAVTAHSANVIKIIRR